MVIEKTVKVKTLIGRQAGQVIEVASKLVQPGLDFGYFEAVPQDVGLGLPEAAPAVKPPVERMKDGLLEVVEKKTPPKATASMSASVSKKKAKLASKKKKSR